MINLFLKTKVKKWKLVLDPHQPKSANILYISGFNTELKNKSITLRANNWYQIEFLLLESDSIF